MMLSNFFDLKGTRNVPTARYSINPVPNEVRCGVQDDQLYYAYRRHATDIQLVAYLQYALFHCVSGHPAQQAVCTGLIGYRAFSTTTT